MEPARDTPVRTYHATFPDSVTNAEDDERNGPPTLEKCGEFKKQDRNDAKTERALEKTEKPATFEKKASSRHNSLTSAERFLAPRSTALQLSFTVARVHRQMLRAVSAPR